MLQRASREEKEVYGLCFMKQNIAPRLGLQDVAAAAADP